MDDFVIVAQKRHELRRAIKREHEVLGRLGLRRISDPDIRCPDRHLADAEVLSLGLSFCSRRVTDTGQPMRLLKCRADFPINGISAVEQVGGY